MYIIYLCILFVHYLFMHISYSFMYNIYVYYLFVYIIYVYIIYLFMYNIYVYLFICVYYLWSIVDGLSYIRTLLPVRNRSLQRLSQLEVMSMACIHIRRCHFLGQPCKYNIIMYM